MQNFGIIEPGIYRSGRHTMRSLNAYCHEYAIRRVVDLRSSTTPLLAASTYRRMGVECIRYPIDEEAPVPHDVLQWFQAGTLIHCRKGIHRTGAAVALYRKTICQWEDDAIWQELNRYGFGCMDKHTELLKGVVSCMPR